MSSDTGAGGSEEASLKWVVSWKIIHTFDVFLFVPSRAVLRREKTRFHELKGHVISLEMFDWIVLAD